MKREERRVKSEERKSKNDNLLSKIVVFCIKATKKIFFKGCH